MTRPRHMAVSSWGRPRNPHSTGCLSTVAVLVLWLVLFAGVMTAACSMAPRDHSTDPNTVNRCAELDDPPAGGCEP